MGELFSCVDCMRFGVIRRRNADDPLELTGKMVGVVIARLLGYLADPPPGGQKESVRRRFVSGL